MSNRALAGVETLASHGKTKKPAPKPKPAQQIDPDPILDPEDEYVVRVPRTTPAPKAGNVQSFSEANTLLDKRGFGKRQETEERREKILAWMLNGHLHEGQLMTPTDLAENLNVPLMTVQADMAHLKEQMGEFHTTEELKDVPALAHMLMEMKFQDRGRALALYNIIMADIRAADEATAAIIANGIPKKGAGALTGRDRAAMYSAALTALDLSNKATNGMDSLFKLTGGAQRLQQIIKAKNLTINNNNGPVFTIPQLQEFIANELGAVLPSTRKVNPQLPPPKTITLDAEDMAVLAIGDKKK